MSDPPPPRVGLLPRDHTGRPVPWFVHWYRGSPDFRVIGASKIEQAVTRKLCWVCGVPFDRQEARAFLIGPMCAVNRVSSEPPSHHDCAVYSAVHCPFLSRPNMTRRERGMEDKIDAPGISISRNPGVALVWGVRYNGWGWRPEPRPDGRMGVLFDIGEPLTVLWFREGRPATRAEVVSSIETGLPVLREHAAGEAGLAELAESTARAMELVPS